MSQSTFHIESANGDTVSLIIKAAKGWSTWGRYAAERYAVKRGLDLRLVRLARQLESTKGV